MTAPRPIRLKAVIERKLPSLPRYAVVPAELVKPWAISATTVIEGTLDGVPLGRKTIKKWDDDRWFIDVTQTTCHRAGVDTGDTVTLELRIASTALPDELASLLVRNRAARAAWERLSESGRRMEAENVRAAKTAETRRRRAEKLVGRLASPRM